jgi:hypothetical protein
MKRLLFIALFVPLFAGAQSLKNLDIKNGFLQFHLGDSVSVYKNDIYIPWQNHPDQNEVKQSALGEYRKLIDKVTLVNVDGIITEIDVMLDKYQEGTHLTTTTWKGQRVTAMVLQNNINKRVNGTMMHARIQSIVFTLTDANKVAGNLPDDFPKL